MHFHAPSEHTIDGQSKALELHIVHVDAITGKPAAVLGVLFEVQDDVPGNNPFLDGIAPDIDGSETDPIPDS